MKIAVYGSAVAESEELTKSAKIIGEEIFKSGSAIITGACKGLPFDAAEKAKSLGGFSIGYTSDIFGCQRCDCRWQLEKAKNMIHEKGGLIIYHFHREGRGFGFTSKLRSLQFSSPIDAIFKEHNELDHRRYYSTVKILEDPTAGRGL